MNQNTQQQRHAAAVNTRKPLMQFFYVYSAEITGVAAAGNGTDTVQIQADSTFLLQALTGILYVDAGTVPTDTRFKVQITDTGSGANVFDEPQTFANIFGSAQLPFLLPVSRVFMPNSALQVTLYNNSGAGINGQFSFHGQKLYEASR